MRCTIAGLTLAACAASRPPVAPPAAPAPRVAIAPQPAANTCQLALLALVDARLDGWVGSDGCTRDDVEHVFGRPAHDDLEDGSRFRQTYDAIRSAPLGVEVTYASDHRTIVEIAIQDPRLAAADAHRALGAAEATAPSGIGPDTVQEVYAARGVTLHVTGGDVVGIVAYPRTTAAAFLVSPMSDAFDVIEEEPDPDDD